MTFVCVWWSRFVTISTSHSFFLRILRLKASTLVKVVKVATCWHIKIKSWAVLVFELSQSFIGFGADVFPCHAASYFLFCQNKSATTDISDSSSTDTAVRARLAAVSAFAVHAPASCTHFWAAAQYSTQHQARRGMRDESKISSLSFPCNVKKRLNFRSYFE